MLEGILAVDKPQGITSHDVVAQVRRLAQTRRVGHAGTLDPLATGVLVVCIGRATRLVEYLVGRPKVYTATIRLGIETDTYDADGSIVAERPLPPDLNTAQLDAALNPFRGPIQQIPPMFSAIKKAGQPLYKLARQGKEVERQPRAVTIYQLDLLKWEAPDLELRITCSAGTYIRSIAHDLGQQLQCGGHIIALRRTAVGELSESDAQPLAALTSENLPGYLLPADRAVAHLPRLELSAEEVVALEQGKGIPRQAEPTGDLLRVYAPNGRFAGLIRPAGEAWRPHKMFTQLDGA